MDQIDHYSTSVCFTRQKQNITLQAKVKCFESVHFTSDIDFSSQSQHEWDGKMSKKHTFARGFESQLTNNQLITEAQNGITVNGIILCNYLTAHWTA